MNKYTTTERELSTTAKLADYQQSLLKRINNIAVSLMPEFEDKNQAMDAVTLDDGSLMQLLCSIQMEQKTRASEHEMRKVRRRRENLEAFYNSLQELGGTLKVNVVADKLGITRRGRKCAGQRTSSLRLNKTLIISFRFSSSPRKVWCPGLKRS